MDKMLQMSTKSDDEGYGAMTLNEVFAVLSRENDRSLYNWFFNKYYPRLIQFSLLFTKKHHLAEEAVSDVLMGVFKNRERIAKMDNIEGYLFISVKNQSSNLLKKRSRHLFVDTFDNEEDYIMEDSATPESSLLDDELTTVLRQIVDDLPPRRREIFRLIREDKLKYKDVATLLNLSVKTVETHIGLAMKSVSNGISQYRNGDTFKIRSINQTGEDFRGN